MGFRADSFRFGFTSASGAWVLRRLERHLGLHIWQIIVTSPSPPYEIPPEHTARFTFKRLSLEEVLASTNNPELGMTADFVHAAFDRGDICVGALEADKLVAYCWRGFTCAPVIKDLWLRLRINDARYGYKIYVLPQYRGIRLRQSVASFYEHHFVEMGATKLIGYIAVSNLASLRHPPLQAAREVIGYAGYMKRRGHYRTFRSPRVREYLAFEVR